MWSDAVQQGFMGISGINPRRRHLRTGMSYTLAARLIGSAPADTPADKEKDATKKDADKKKDEKPAAAAAKINVIAIADLDMISENFFGLRRRKIENLDFDNVPFVLNCVDVLAGDESYVSLRKKRPKHRTLIQLEAQAKTFTEELQEQTKAAENAAKDKLDEAQQAFSKEVDQVRSRTDLDERTKESMLENLQAVAQRRLDVQKQLVEDQKLNKIRESKAESERKIRKIQNNVRFAAASIPPLPPLILGFMVWIARLRRENLGANPKRLA
jgi:ABC-2 type transport system permease protein